MPNRTREGAQRELRHQSSALDDASAQSPTRLRLSRGDRQIPPDSADFAIPGAGTRTTLIKADSKHRLPLTIVFGWDARVSGGPRKGRESRSKGSHVKRPSMVMSPTDLGSHVHSRALS